MYGKRSMSSTPTARCSTSTPRLRAIARPQVPDADRFSDIWRTKQLEYTWTLTLAGHYVDFWTLTERALDFAFARVPSVDRALGPICWRPISRSTHLPMRVPHLPASRQRGARLAILSNGTPRMLACGGRSSRHRRPSRCRAVGRCGALYKPRPEVYALVTDALSVKPADVTFVSSNRWDVMGAVSFGFHAFWVNRARMPDEYPDFAPLQEIPGLTALLERLTDDSRRRSHRGDCGAD